MKDPLSAIANKRKKSELSKPQPVSTHFTASAPSSPALHKPQPRKAQRKAQVQQVQSPKVKPVVKPVRPKIKQQQRPQVQQTQQPQQPHQPRQTQYQNTDFKFMTSVDQAGIAIITNFRGKLIHKFLLPHTDYALFVALNPQQKYNYVQVRVRPNSFWNDMQLVDQVILTICNILDTLFAEANRIIAQQAHTQRRM